MKSTLQLTAAVLLAITCWAAQPSERARQAVLQAEEAWKAAVLNKDKNVLDKLLSADLTYTHSSAKTQTKEQFIQDVIGGGTVYKSISFGDPKLRQYGSVIVLIHSAEINTVQTGPTHLYITEVWAQEDGRWQMASRQATKLP